MGYPIVALVEDTLHTKGTPKLDTNPYEDVEHGFEVVLVAVLDQGGWVWS